MSEKATSGWLNYHHLFYFWRITQDGGLAKAAAKLRVSHSTVSAQLRALEEFFGARLFERRGRRLVLTPLGSQVALYASDIFRMGEELVDVVRGDVQKNLPAFKVGVVGALPKTVVSRLLEPALRYEQRLRMHVRQGDLARLLPELGAHRLHLLLSDRPVNEGHSQPVYSHLLGESEIWLYGTKPLVARYRRGFPRSLDGAPVLFPGSDAALRTTMERWFAERGLRVVMAGDADDAGLLRVLGAEGVGLFPVRAVLRGEIDSPSGASAIGCLSGAREQYYAISVERRIRHRAVATLIESARSVLVKRTHKQPRKP